DFFGIEVVDNTTIPERVLARREESSMIGIFLEEMHSIAPENQPQKGEGVLDQRTYEKALKLGLHALEQKEGFPL
ncbi:MAG: hypothetical protein R3Y07_09575, partial [Eubacteriales bacterium]